jgi:endonuclease YncB( thermonuclease family)
VAIFAIPVFAADFAGTIVVLIDGDTIEVPHNHHSERIRLNGIDCPAMRAI